MNYIMKKKSALRAVTAILLLVLAVPSFAGAHTEYTAYNWYVKRNTIHDRPALDPKMAFVENYDCYYVDKREDKVIYLTFDAGYENGNIAKILDILQAHQAPAAFFVLENLFDRNPDLITRMVNEGHTVCNHTLRHPDMTKLTDPAQFEAQLQGLSDRYRALIGCDMAKIYRPPEGRFSEHNLKLLQDMGYKTVLWSFAYADWDNNKQPGEEYALKKILDNIHDGAILLLHPTSATNVAIMDRLLSELEGQGYRFGRVEELPSPTEIGAK